jgi:hypothetical protein
MAWQRECLRIFNKVNSETLGEITTFGKPPANVATSAHSQGKLFSPRIGAVVAFSHPQFVQAQQSALNHSADVASRFIFEAAAPLYLQNVRQPSSLTRRKDLTQIRPRALYNGRCRIETHNGSK